MTGDVYDYNKDRIYIMSGEKRIIIDFEDGEYEYWRNNGLLLIEVLSLILIRKR